MLRILYSWPSLLSLSVALSIAISHMMQLGNAPLTASLLERADATETSELTNISYTAAFDVDRQDTSVIVPETTAPTYATCTPIVETAHLAEATIEMSVTAPCHANKRFSVHHNGLMLGYKLGDNGSLTFELPVLAQNAIILTEFPDNFVAVNRIRVQTLAAFDRTALQWDGSLELSLEPTGASTIPVTRKHVGSPEARQATILTAARSDNMDSMPSLQVKTKDSSVCGTMVNFQTISVRNAQAAQVSNFDLTAPDCDAASAEIILKNLIEPTTLAWK